MTDDHLRELERRLRESPADLALAFQLASERARAARPVPVTFWELERDGRLHFATVDRKNVVVGDRGRSGHDEAAGTARHGAFLLGEYQAHVLRVFGSDVLVAMLEATLRAPDLYAWQSSDMARKHRHLAAIPVDPSLARAPRDEGPVWWAGTTRLVVPSDTHALEVTAGPRGETTAALVPHDGGARRPVALRHGLRAAIGIADRFFVATDSYLVIEPTGELHVPEDAALFGSDLRLDRVSRLGEAAVFAYWWFDHEEGKPGLLRYEHGRGFVARCDR